MATKNMRNDADLEAIKKNRNPRTFHAFIPNRLNIENSPQYSNMPYNIMFVSYAKIDGANTSGTALYLPDFFSFKEDEAKESMTYVNQYGSEWTVEIVYDKQKGSWDGSKYHNDECKGSGGGTEWNMAFVHLTAIGIVKGEMVKFEKLARS